MGGPSLAVLVLEKSWGIYGLVSKIEQNLHFSLILIRTLSEFDIIEPKVAYNCLPFLQET